MTERLDDVWTTRDYPVLLDVTRRKDEGQHFIRMHEVVETTGLTNSDVQRAASALERRGLVATTGTIRGALGFTDVAGAAYLMTGLHPDTDNALSALVQLLRDAADIEPDEDERGNLRRAADAIGGVSRGVMTGVLTAYLTGQIPH